VQVLYWLALSTWFGGALFIAVAAEVIFRTVKEHNPILPQVLSVNLEGQHGNLLAGTIVGHLISASRRIESACAAVLLVTMSGQWFLLDLQDPTTRTSMFVRSALYIAASGVLLFDGWFLWPRIWKFRQAFIDNADDPEKANPAHEQFDRYQRESELLLLVLVFLLLGIVLFSGSMGHVSYAYQAHNG
jgi:hypothetical protein